jgi:hypothetical protein
MVHYAYGAFLQSQRDYRDAVRQFQSFIDLAAGQRPADDIERVRKHIATLRGYYHD